MEDDILLPFVDYYFFLRKSLDEILQKEDIQKWEDHICRHVQFYITGNPGTPF
jgi:hypothetical protein